MVTAMLASVGRVQTPRTVTANSRSEPLAIGGIVAAPAYPRWAELPPSQRAHSEETNMDSDANRLVWLWHHPPADAPDDACLGWLDPPLRDRPQAREWAEAVALRVRAAGAAGAGAAAAVAGVWSSDLRRARQAARPLSKALGVAHMQTRALREASFGSWEGRLWRDIRAEEPERHAEYMAHWQTAAMPGGESWKQVQRRVAEWWATLDQVAGARVIVGHAGSLRAVAALLCDWTPEEAIAMNLARGYLACIDRAGEIPPSWNLHPLSPLGR
jgi:probable phosphoglycerate mutase